MNEYEIGLKFNDGNMPEQLRQIYAEGAAVDKQFDDIQGSLNKIGTSGADSLNKYAKAAQQAFNGQSVAGLNTELSKLAKTIDGAGGVADAVDSLGKEYLKLKRDADILKGALKNATDPAAIKVYNEALKTLTAGMATLSKTAKAAGVDLNEVEKNASTGSQVFDNFFGQFTKVTLIIAAIEAVLEYTKYATGLAAAIEKSQKAFEGYFQSAETARVVTDKLVRLSNEKLLPVDDVLAAGKALAGYGLEADKIDTSLGRIAEISAATGKDLGELTAIYGKARTSGVLYAEDVNQLLDAGINIIPQFAKQLNVSNDAVKKLASEGKIKFEELQLAFFNLTDKGGVYAGQLAKKTETLGGAFDALVTRFQPVTLAIGDFFNKALQGLILFANDAIDQIGRAATYVGNLFKTEQEIEEERIRQQKVAAANERTRQNNLIREREKLEEEARKARNKKTAEQLDKEKKEREKAAKEEAEREKKRTELRIAGIQDETEKLIAQVQQRGKEEEAQIRELFTAKGKLTAEGEDLILKSREKTAGEIEKINSDAFTKEQEIFAERLENEQKFTESYLSEQQARAASAKQIEDTAIQTAEQQVEGYLLRLKAQGATEGEIKALKEQFDLEIQKRRLLNELKFQEAILATTDAGDVKRREQVAEQIKLLQAQIGNVQFQIDNPDPVKADKLKGGLDKIKKDIAKSLGIEPGALDDIVGSAVDSYNQIFSAIQEITQAQIAENDKLIESINKRVDEQEKALEREKEFAEQGKANNVKSEQEKLDALLVQQEEYQKKGQELRDKAARQQLIQDGIAQISNTVSAVAKIYNANAGIPVVGLILAAAQVAALFAGLAAARAKAKAASAERLFTGGEIPWGKTDEGGREGYRIEGTNLMVGGGEYVVNRKITKPNRSFLEKFNAGMYKGLDMEAVVADFHARQQERRAYFGQSSQMVDAMYQRKTDRTGDIVGAIQSGNNQLLRYGFNPIHKQGQYFVDADGNEVHVRTDASGNQFRSKKIAPNRSKRNGRTK